MKVFYLFVFWPLISSVIAGPLLYRREPSTGSGGSGNTGNTPSTNPPNKGGAKASQQAPPPQTQNRQAGKPPAQNQPKQVNPPAQTQPKEKTTPQVAPKEKTPAPPQYKEKPQPQYKEKTQPQYREKTQPQYREKPQPQPKEKAVAQQQPKEKLPAQPHPKKVNNPPAQAQPPQQVATVDQFPVGSIAMAKPKHYGEHNTAAGRHPVVVVDHQQGNLVIAPMSNSLPGNPYQVPLNKVQPNTHADINVSLETRILSPANAHTNQHWATPLTPVELQNLKGHIADPQNVDPQLHGKSANADRSKWGR